MAKKKKRRLKKSVKIILGLIVAIIVISIALFVNWTFFFAKSSQSGAKKYHTSSCLAFYPDSKLGKQKAKELCKAYGSNSEKKIYDYSLVPSGDYYLVSYGPQLEYYADAQYQAVSIDQISEQGKKIVADYLRYSLKKENNEAYYDSKYLASLVYDKINFDHISYALNGQYISAKYQDYNLEAQIPIGFMQEAIGMNLGFPNEKYHKPVYLDDTHPIICFTFDDGPQLWSEPGNSTSEKIVGTLYKYDATATFFTVGNCLQERDVWSDYEVYDFLNNSIQQGNEYGSHTQEHIYLTDFDQDKQVVEAISGPKDFFKDFLDYDMKFYRPVGGVFSDEILQVEPLCAILWNIDSLDWQTRDVQATVDKIMGYANDNKLETGDIIIMHDIYDESAQAIEKLVPALVDEGYQLASVADLFDYLHLSSEKVKYFYSPDYYE